jgi:hypothetical protein
MIDKKIYGYGHWEVAGRTYHNKFKAFEDAFSIGHTPHWNFYEEEFSKYDWTVEPEESITELYKQRVQQIRDTHDYVIVMFSGGCDSWTIVDSCIKAGVLVDEIWSLAGHEWCDPNDTSRNPGNLANETRFAAIPEAKKFLQRDPRIKYKVFDAAQLITDYWSKNKPNAYEEHWISPEGPLREITETLDDQYVPKSSFNRIVRISGIDKPRLLYQDGKFYMRFFDLSILCRSSMKRTVLTDIHDYDMAFYWHPDSTKIMIKQGHMIKNYFKAHPEHMHLLTVTTDPVKRLFYQDLLNRIIYPDYDFSIWQADKDYGGAFDNKCYLGFTNNDNSTASNNWRNTVGKFSDAVYQLYENNNRLDSDVGSISKTSWYYNLPGCYSKHYCLGE